MTKTKRSLDQSGPSQTIAARRNLTEAIQELNDHMEDVWECKTQESPMADWWVSTMLRIEISHWATTLEMLTGEAPQIPRYARLSVIQ